MKSRAAQGLKPSCWNREPFGNYLLQDGWEPGYTLTGQQSRQPVMVEHPFGLSPGCKAWASDPSTDPVPLAEGWPCETCRWFPNEDVATAVARRAKR